MKKATVLLLILIVWLVPQAPAQDVRPIPQDRRVAAEQEHVRDARSQQRLPFAPAIQKEQIEMAVTPQERQRLHPFFQAVVAEERLGLVRTFDREAIRDMPGLGLRGEDGRLLYSATIHTDDPGAIERLGIHLNARFDGLVTARLTAEQAGLLAAEPVVRHLEPAELLYPANDMSVTGTGAHLLHEGFVRNTPYQGEGAIVCVFDTGIDFRHEDFVDEDGQSRILSIWDQTLDDLVAGEQRPSGFNYGVEYTRTHINNELSPPSTGFVRQRDSSGHGTHVAGTAAGNGRSHHGIYRGMAPKADLVIVKGGDESFPTTNTIDGISYCGQVAAAEGKPVVVNLSLSGQFGPHDGSRSHELVIDQFVQQPGRVVVASAGNRGNNSIHIHGTVPAGGTHTIEFEVPQYEPEPDSDNDYFRFDAWFDDEFDITATVTSPPVNNGTITATYDVGEAGTHSDDRAGTIYVFNNPDSAYDGQVLRTNVQVYDESEQRPPVAGTWQLTFTNNDTQAATFHGWMYSVSSSLSGTEVVDGDSLYTVGSPASSRGAITVGSYNTRTLWPSTNGSSYRFLPDQPRGEISNFSSIGPTRDGRIKPDLVAPGRTVVSSRSQDGEFNEALITPSNRHRATVGTSMSAPHVTGAAALLLTQFPSYSAQQIKDLLTSAAEQDDFTQASIPGIADNRHVWGAGKLNVFRAMLHAFGGSVAEQDRHFYAGEADARFNLGSGRVSVRVTPEQSGVFSGFEVHVASLNRDAGVEAVDGDGHVLYALYDNDNGLPGQPITDVISRPLSQITPTSRSYFSLLPAGLENLRVEAGQHYHVVFYLENSNDTFEILADDGSNLVGRSSVYNATTNTWTPTAATFAAPREFRVASFVTRVDEAAEMPVTLAFFDVEVANGEARLSWRTTMERNIDRIEIQHARPRDTYSTVGERDGGGTTEEPRDYSFTIDDFQGVGEHRFRLRFVSDGGAWAYSNEHAYLQEVDGRYNLSQPYPNPFTERVHVRLSVAEEQNVEAHVYDLLGRRIATIWDGPLTANFEEIVRFYAPGLSSGLYIIHVIGEHFTDSRTVTKVR